MTGTLILWTHALAALLFGVLGVNELRGGLRARRGFAVALLLTGLWALTVAGIGPHDGCVAVAQGARDIAWLALAAMLVRRAGSGSGAVTCLCTVIAVLLVLAAAITLAEGSIAHAPTALTATAETLRVLALLAGMMLLHHLAQATLRHGRGDQRLFVLALALMWGVDLGISAATLLQRSWPDLLVLVRGGAMTVVAVLLAAAARSGGRGGMPALSRTALVRVLSAVAVLLYAGATVIIADAAGALAGEEARLVQTAIVIGAAAALMALVSTPWLRSWLRVKLAKHLFSHRYDYRVEWQRFTAALARGGGEASLGLRVVRAVANLTDSPAGMLLLIDEGTIAAGPAWNWPTRVVRDDAGFVAELGAGRIVALDAVREGEGSAPPALTAMTDAWIVVPLLHGGHLSGAIVLAHPPVARALDWEDLDLLRVVGRQAASYLAEDRAHTALADVARFDEFNRRFAFLMHDMKNVVSQLSLVARNAERHADNPAFRADMIATLRESSDRMTSLLARLGRQEAVRPEPGQPVDVAALVERIARERRAIHPVELAVGAAVATAQPLRLAQAIGHLLQNATEASAPGVPVRISVGMGERVTIVIEDRGCGMAAGFVRDELFRPFASTKPAGFGIGAYQARELVRGMGGTLVVDSREGEGTRFIIELPVAAALAAA